MRLDEEKCIKILEEYLKKNCKSLYEVEKIIEHTKRVLEICKKIVKYYDDEFDEKKKKLIFISAIFHDIGKIEYGKKHNKKAKKIFKEIFEKDEDLKKIFHIIEYHKGKFNPEKSNIIVPAAILRIADNIDKINKNKIDEFVDKYPSSMREIKKCLKKEDYERFKEVCDIVKIEIIVDNILLNKMKISN